MHNEFPLVDFYATFKQQKSFDSHFYCETSSTNMYFLSLDSITSTYEKQKSGNKSGDKILVIIVGIVIPVVLVIAVTVAVFFYKKVR